VAPCGYRRQGLPQLSGLTQLENLSLYATKISDAGLPSLAGLTNLKSLDLNHTAVTNAGVAALAPT